MRIIITAKGIVSTEPWSGQLCIDGEYLSDQIIAAIGSNNDVSETPFASVTVEIFVHEPKKLKTTINGKIFNPKRKTEETV